jgi:YbbR domain-containing protein
MQIVSTSTNTVRLYLSGSGALISSMRADQVRVKIDLHQAQNGENRFPISNDSIVIPPGVRLNRIEPSEVDLVLDIPVAKILPVQADWVDALPENLIMESLVIKPDQVSVEGPSHRLAELHTLYTQKLSLQNLTASGQLTVPLALEPFNLRLSEDFKKEVVIKYTIRKREVSGLEQELAPINPKD